MKIQKQQIYSLKKKIDQSKSERKDLESKLDLQFELVEKIYISNKLTTKIKNEFYISKGFLFNRNELKIEKYIYNRDGELRRIEYFEDDNGLIDPAYMDDMVDESEETEVTEQQATEKVAKEIETTLKETEKQPSTYDLIEKIEKEGAIKTTSFTKFKNSWTPIEQTIEYPINSKNESAQVYTEMSTNNETTTFRYKHDQLGRKIMCFEEGEKDSALTIFKYDEIQNLMEKKLYRNPDEKKHRDIAEIDENFFKKIKYDYDEKGRLEGKSIIYLSPDLGTESYKYFDGKSNESLSESISNFFSENGKLSEVDLKYLRLIDVINKITPVKIEIYKNEIRTEISKKTVL